MTILDTIKNALRATPQGDVGYLHYFSHYENVEDYVFHKPIAELVEQQPHLRTVVTFVARNIAQLGLHTFERVSDTDRRRVSSDPVAMTIRRPNNQMTTYDLIYRLLADFMIYDEAVWLVVPDLGSESGWTIQPIPIPWVEKYSGGDMFGPDTLHVLAPGATRSTPVPMDQVIRFHGWHPEALTKGMTPITALRKTLAEQIHAMVYRDQQWRRAGRFGTVISRPKEAPSWTPDTKRKFKDALDAKMSGEGTDAGGSIILEDGMTAQRMGFSAKEDEFIEGTKLALTTVAQVYHVNPTMIGLLDNANFSNVKEFRKMLYGETLGPLLKMITDRLNTFMVPRMALDPDIYVEFNVEAKLRGSFEEQATIMSTSTGGPWMTRNEARAMQNLPEIEGGDDLIIPLNVLVGGQASPQDATPDAIEETTRQTNAGIAKFKSRAPDTYQTNTERILKAFYRRQGKAVLSALGAKDGEDWWDEARWNRELSDDLYKLAVLTATKIGQETAESLGFDPDAYDEGRTLRFLRAVADSRAAGINGATKRALDDALAASEDEEAPKPPDVFKEAEEVRSVAGAAALVTAFSAFATTEAARQLIQPGKAYKVWNVQSKNPRSSHARMNGERVPVDQKFSNGADWPGDPVLGADGVAGCKCGVTIEIED